MPSQELRRILAESGAPGAGARPAASHGRRDEAEIQEAHVVEGGRFEVYPVGPPEACPEAVAFLDGAQQHEVLTYTGAVPLVSATVAAAVRERHGRDLALAGAQRRHLVVGRAEALDGLPRIPVDVERVEISEDEPFHPIRDLDTAVAMIDRARRELEVRVGTAFRKRSNAWLIVDGSLAISPAWAADPRMLSVSKSHATLPFGGDELRRYLQLPGGHRSSVYQPDTSRLAPVYAWGLRLWPWQGRDLLFGLVRVEAAPTPETLVRVDELSRWLLAERAPISSADARWDRLLYGIHSVEQYLRAAHLDR